MLNTYNDYKNISMKKLIFRNFYFDVFKNFMINLFVLGTIVWVIQAVNYLDFISEDGHGFDVYLKYTALSFPKIINRLVPFVFFISLFITILNYENRNELYIFWINGISKNHFLGGLLFLSFFLVMFQILTSAFITPYSQLMARNHLKNSSIDKNREDIVKIISLNFSLTESVFKKNL